MKNKMRTVFFTYSIFFLLFVVGCKKDENNAAKYQIEVNERNETEKSLNDFIQDVQYIKLETTEESLLGYVTKLTITDDRIYVLDQFVSKALFVFDKAGRFIYKIDRKGNGPGEYAIITDFCLDEKEKNIRLLANGRKVINFDYDGKFINEQTLPLQSCSFMLPVAESGYCLINQPSADADCLLYFTDSDFHVSNKNLKTPKGWSRIARASNIYYSGYQENRYLYTYVCSALIYELQSETVSPKYEFCVPVGLKLTEKNIVTFEKLNKQELVKKTLDYFSLDSYFELGSRLFVEFSMENKFYWGMYDTRNDIFEYAEREPDNMMDDFVYPLFFLSQIAECTLAGVIMPDAFPEGNGLGVTENSNPVIGIYKFVK